MILIEIVCVCVGGGGVGGGGDNDTNIPYCDTEVHFIRRRVKVTWIHKHDHHMH